LPTGLTVYMTSPYGELHYVADFESAQMKSALYTVH
jgi:hypothetical protein